MPPTLPPAPPPARALDPNVAWMLWDTAERAPAAPAIVERERVVSYGELRARAAGVAEGLRAAGVSPGDRVGIFLERGAESAAAIFGVVACGAVAVIINETLRTRQVDHILSHCAATVLLTARALLIGLPRPPEGPARVLDVAALPSSGPGLPSSRIGADLAQIIYTSGSTGLPKGVTLTHSNLWAGARSVTQYLEITRDDRVASLLPFSFDYGFNQLLCALLTGASLVVERSPVPQQIAATLRVRAVTVLAAIPPLWLQLLGAPEFRRTLPALRVMTNTGGRLPVDGVRRLRALHPAARLYLMYGLTEAFRATYLPPDLVDAHPDSIGRAIPGAQILVLREDQTECGPGETGELVQRGPTVAAGYWNDPELTARVYRPFPLRARGAPVAERVVFSGDLVRKDEEGLLYFVGRHDRMIKTLGFRVSPDEIEEVLYTSGEVAEVLVGTEPDEVRGERLVAFVVLAEGGSLDALQRFCRTEMPRYMQPGRIEVRDRLPRTATGKFDLRAAQGEEVAV